MKILSLGMFIIGLRVSKKAPCKGGLERAPREDGARKFPAPCRECSCTSSRMFLRRAVWGAATSKRRLPY